MTDEEMRFLIEEAVRGQHRAAALTAGAGLARLRAPASTEALARLATNLRANGLHFPPSYRQFLSITDGIDDLMDRYGVSFRPADEVIAGLANRQAWTWTPVHRFVIASGNSNSFIGFDPRTVAPDGEMRAVLFNDKGEENEADSLPQFLQDQVDFFEDVVAWSTRTMHSRGNHNQGQ
jgi:hypothetical protein